jgi:hypothetical protein
MSHFAQVKNNIVQQVIVAEQEFINSLSDASDWIQTSYNTRGNVHYDPNTNEPDGGIALRYNYAANGYIYDSEKDAFIQPQPFPSWTLNENTCLWEPPIPHPIDGNLYNWDEEQQQWILLTY